MHSAQTAVPRAKNKATWADRLAGRAILWFVDNNSALTAVIRSFSAVLENFELLLLNAALDVRLQCMNWYTRVPSKSNPSDSPCRMCFDELAAKGFVRCEPLYASLTIGKMGERRERQKMYPRKKGSATDSPVTQKKKGDMINNELRSCCIFHMRVLSDMSCCLLIFV